jgi:hypothetical protein
MNCGKIFLGLFCLVPALPSLSWADEFKVIPFGAVRQEYNNNILFSHHNKEDDWITTGYFGLKLQEKTERLTADLEARGEALAYADNNRLNTVDQFYYGNLSYQFSPKLSLSSSGGYSEDSRSDRDVESSGYALNSETRTRKEYSVSADYILNEKMTSFLSYSYLDDDFEDSFFDNMTAKNAVIGLTRQLAFTKPTTARFYSRYSHYDFYSSITENYYFTFGAARQFTEKLNILLDLGPRFTSSRSKFAPISSDDSGMGGQCVIDYKGEVNNYNLRLAHEISGSSGTSTATKRTSLNFNYRHRLTYELTARLGLDCIYNEADRRKIDYANDFEELSLSIKPAVRYAFNQDMYIEGLYKFTEIDDRVGNDDRTRNMIYIFLRYQWPVIE